MKNKKEKKYNKKRFYFDDNGTEEYEEYEDGHKSGKHLVLWGIPVIILLVAIILASARINTFKVIGNTRYSSEEMVKLIYSDDWDTNSFYCFLKDKTSEHKQIPFIQRYDIDWEGPFSVVITVYEKNVVGYVDYMSSHMYFDKDGIVVESTGEKLEGIPKITGLSFGSIVLYKELPVQNMQVFKDILNLTGSLSENKINCDEIAYDNLLNATLYIGDIEVQLGGNENMEMKIYTLRDILPKLDGLKGELNLANYNESSDHESYIFKTKKQ
ncbi:cell division protein FtsQ/DivIB [Oribacterium sp. WCC10]|uniref:cell division protein FtsQ/DivIB n=1 Tax=Oribacterium sp. WCC10 TaxID=1855343 RepID=UPI0008E0EFA4|nr:cell division protein FtsQ/DivIB [Oribacterium sp. WCC10]SFG26411.1 cell division protein FtsQ [Oribacterium sp. WCC10]